MNDKTIEEMAKDLEMVEKEAYSKIAKETQLFVKEYHRYNSKEDYSLAHTKSIYELVAEALIKIGYTKNKIPEGSVVLTREEHIQMLKDCIQSNKLVEESSRKRTAKNILQAIKDEVEYRNGATLEEDLSIDATILQEVLNELAKQFGVEVEE